MPSRRLDIKSVMLEVKSSLPGRHQPTQLGLPEDPLDPGYDAIGTGDSKSYKISSLSDFFVGGFFWAIWIGFGVHNWWFAKANFTDFIIVSIGWLIIFLFTIIGVPMFRVYSRDRYKN